MAKVRGRKALLERIEEARGKAGPIVARRMDEFRAGGEWFPEMCFCILTANYTAEGGMRIQKEIGPGFAALTLEGLAAELKRLGHRFPNTRAKYIFEAREYMDEIGGMLCECGSGMEMREWLAGNVKGLGYKEASHFLRNMGRKDVAIIDFHIMDILARHGLIEKPKTKTLTKKRYLEIESVLSGLAGSAGLSLAELDLYLWYLETGKVLK